jgi:uncharacterized protein (TIGR04222 family)
MYGPFFLLVYVLFIALVYYIGNHFKNELEKEFSHSSITVLNTPEPNPYLMTYMRAGVSETTKIVTFNLCERGYLISSWKKKEVKQDPGHPPLANLTQLEKLIFDPLEESHTIEEVVDDVGILQATDSICQQMIKDCKCDELLHSESSSKGFRKIKIVMRITILLFGGYKLIVALHNGHQNVFFLIVLMLLGIGFAGRFSKPSRLTIAGKNYLSDLQNIYYTKYKQGILYATANYKVLLAAIFGVSLLKDLGYDYLLNYEKVKHVTYSDSGSCGSISSSSGGDGGDSGGSSCGGGCGGCGGGGGD